MNSRLDKLLSDSGQYSRSEAKALIRAGRVTVDGVPAAAPEQKADAESAVIRVDGEVVVCTQNRYFVLNKPGGVLSATEDREQRTVIDLLPESLQRLGLFPVGRLDKDTTGLLLLTNDGDFAHRVASPRHHVPKCYRAAVDGVLDEADVSAFAEGLILADGTRCRSAILTLERPSVGIVTVYEGKYHLVKRMFASRGKNVTALHRLSVGGMILPADLAPGQLRELTRKEAEQAIGKITNK